MLFRKKKNESSLTSDNVRRRFHHFLISKRKTPGTPLRRHLPYKTISSLKRSTRLPSSTKIFIKRFVLPTAATLFVISGIYTVFFSSFFSIKDIRTEKKGAAVGVTELVPFFDKLKGQNILFVDTDKVALEVQQAFRTKILLVTVKKSYPNRLSIKVDEYPPVLVFKIVTSSEEKVFMLNQIGYIINPDGQQKDLPLLTLHTDAIPKDASQLIDDKKLTLITDTIKKFTDIFGIKVVSAEWKKIERELHLTTEKKFTVWVDLTADITKQLAKLKRALVKLDIYHEPLDYIDVRIASGDSEKVIFKRK